MLFRSDVDMTVMATELRERGFSRVSCEGGPALLDSLATRGLVDELFLTTAPMWIGVADLHLGAGVGAAIAGDFEVSRLMLGEDSYLYTQWRARGGQQQ